MKRSRLENIGSAAVGIAHDINNQLTIIVNHLSAAEIESARGAIDRCSALTESLLAYCRAEVVDLSAVNPTVFLERFAAQLRLPLNVDLVLKIPPSLPAIAANTLSLKRALTNLVSNACAAMEGCGTLQIAAAPGTIEVSDSGPGIPADRIRLVFEPFFSTKGAHGTGLGLSIARELMREQGGSITVHCEPGCGAQFTLHFRGAQVDR